MSDSESAWSDVDSVQRVNDAVCSFIRQLECERSENGKHRSSPSPVASSSRVSQGFASRSRSPLPRLRDHKVGRYEVFALIDCKLESLREDLTQQFLSLTSEIKKDILHSIQEAISPRPLQTHEIKDQVAQREMVPDHHLAAASASDESNLLVPSDFKTKVDLSQAKISGKKEFLEIFEAWTQRLKSCKGDLRTSLVILFPGVGLVDKLHAAVTAMGVRITSESTGATPYAHVAGDQAQPALQIVWKLLPEQKMTIQLNMKKNAVTVRAKRASAEANIVPLLVFLGPALDISSSADAKSKPPGHKGYAGNLNPNLTSFLGWKP